MNEYNSKLHQTADTVDSKSVIQKLTIQSEPNAKLTISNANNVIVEQKEHLKFNLIDDMGKGYQILIKDWDKPANFDAIWTNLSKLTYKDRKINKVIMHFSGIGDNWSTTLANNLYYGFSSFNGPKNIKFEWFYEDGTKVNFERSTAYLAVASLNTYLQKNHWGHERTTVISGGKALALYGSSVSIHNGNELYSGKANSIDADGLSRATSGPGEPDQNTIKNFFPNQKDITEPNIPYRWDTANSSDRYYGAGLIALDGSDLTIKVDVKTDDAPIGVTKNTGQWFNMGTVIPETPGIIPPTIHYHHTNVALGLEINLIS